MIVAGGTVFLDVETAVSFRGQKMIWFERDEFGMAQFNVRMLTTEALKEKMLRVDNNDFLVRGDPTGFDCPPSGRLLRARYDNGDYLKLKFVLLDSVERAVARYPILAMAPDYLSDKLPLAVVEVSMQVAGDTRKRVTPRTIKWNGMTGTNLLVRNCAEGLSLQ